MNQTKPLYHGYRFPPEIIGHAVWLYHRFCLSFRDVEDLLAERGGESGEPMSIDLATTGFHQY
jgi:transposase-like protein